MVSGFADRLDALASTITTDFNILVLGRSPEAMARVVNRVLELQGGIVIAAGDAIAEEWPLPVGGVMTRGTLPEVASGEDRVRAALAARGYPYHDPMFTLFFLTGDFLPAVRLSPRGVWDVKRARVLWPVRRRSG
jgi:adenine deaminase